MPDVPDKDNSPIAVPTKKEGQTRLSGLLFNHKRYSILAYLLTHEDEQLTVGEIIDAVDASRPHVTNFVNDLRDLGLVEKEKKGNMYLITVNEDSPYYEPLYELLRIDAEPLQRAAEEAVDTVLDKHLDRGDRIEDQVVAVELFGSVARGTPQIDSDIDILIIHKEDTIDAAAQDELRDLFAKHGDELKVSFSLTFYTQDEWERNRRRGVAFPERVAEEGLRLHGEQL
jgi:predicted nucleotidyltransferase/DNA-binding transcriptional ArsR family regulator